MVIYFLQFLGLLLVNKAKCIDNQRQTYLFDNSPPENEISEFIFSKGYLPREKELPKSEVVRKIDNDVTYLLSKLSDDELIKLLNAKPNKNVYDLNDVAQIAFGHKSSKDFRPQYQQRGEDTNDQNLKTLQDIPGLDMKGSPQTAYYKLDHRPVYPENQNNKANYLALNKLNELLLTPPLQEDNLNDDKKEVLFDILVAQLRALCCKSTSKNIPQSFKPLSNIGNMKIAKEPQPFKPLSKIVNKKIAKEPQLRDQRLNEFMFLIVNDEIKNKNADEELILVDPDTLDKNSSVLLLGPITSPLTDGQLKVVMKRISNELSKSEYASLLKQLSEGKVSDSNINMMKNFIFGPESRRYIKAHRCNHQSKLAKVFGGPKWLICTGYLNINTPSLYD